VKRKGHWCSRRVGSSSVSRKDDLVGVKIEQMNGCMQSVTDGGDR
jgi:hypothetical protein